MERDYMGDGVEQGVEVVVEPVEPNEYERLERLLRGVVHTIMATRRVDVCGAPQRGTIKRYRRSKRVQLKIARC